MSIPMVLLSSFAGTFGFAMLLNAPKKSWIPSSVVGAAAFLLYYVLTQLGIPEPGSIFLGSLAGSILGQFCARKMKMISTIFLTLSIVSFVPGLGLYRCMELLARSETAGGARKGVEAMVSIAMIALGLGMGSFLFRAVVRGHRNG